MQTNYYAQIMEIYNTKEEYNGTTVNLSAIILFDTVKSGPW